MELANQFGAGIIIAYFLEYLKNNGKCKFLSPEQSARWKAFIGFIAAFLTTVGIHYTFDYNFDQGGHLLINIPSASVLFHSLWDLSKQWAFQQASYDGFVRRGNK